MGRFSGTFISIMAVTLSMASTALAVCEKPSIRKSWSSLSLGEQTEYISSTLCLMNPDTAPAKTGTYGSKSRWEELLVSHMAQVQYIHVTGAFFPWHRWYTKVHEDLLRNECGYTGAYPYWDEQADQASVPLQNASVWSTNPESGFGTGDTDENDCVVDGAFANIKFSLTTNLTQATGTCLRRIFNQAHFDSVSQDIVDSCMDIDDYWEMWGCLGTAPHIGGHFGVGGTMRHVSKSAFDPIFFLHHANLDRLWTEWQSRDTRRLTAMGGPRVGPQTPFGDAQPASLGPDAFIPYFGDTGNVTTLHHNMWMAGIVPNITVAAAMNVENDQMCFKDDR